MSDVAVAHWAQEINGGGERVGWELARTFGNPLYVGEASADCAPPDVTVEDLFDETWYGRALRRGGMLQMAATQLAWEVPPELRGVDCLVTSGNEPLVYVPRPEQPWVAYIHHTSRRATDRLPAVHDGSVGCLVEACARKFERVLYGNYASKPDLLVCNSEAVARRVRRYWGVSDHRIRVCYPPVPVSKFGPDAAPTEDYHIALQRLDDHKRLDQVIAAYRGLDVELKIVGSGSEREALEAQARDADNIEFTGYVSEERKRELLAGAAAKVVNAEREDFGITTVEALAAGTPVIGVAEGFTQHLIRDDVTGIAYNRGADNLRDAVRRFERDGVSAAPATLHRWARQFRTQRFRDEIQRLVDEARDRHGIDPDLSPVPERPQEPQPAVADGGGEPCDR